MLVANKYYDHNGIYGKINYAQRYSNSSQNSVVQKLMPSLKQQVMACKIKKYQKITGITLGLILSLSCFAHENNPWMQLANQDLDAIYSILHENHPGAIDTQNPVFKIQLDEGYHSAKKKIKNIQTFIDYQTIILNYMAGFKDGHLGVSFSLLERSQPYPGFIAHYQDNHFFVSESIKPNALPNGAELIACDGKRINDILLQDVFPMRTRNPALKSSWYTSTPYLLQGYLPSWKKPYTHCQIRVNGHESMVKLQYTMISEVALTEKISKVFFGDSVTFHVTRLPQNTIWIRLPRFFPKTDDELNGLRDIIRQSPQFKQAQYIVFDLRGNTGGDSSWGEQLLSNIYGQAYLDNIVRTRDKNTQVLWRISKANLRYLEKSTLNHATEHQTESIYTKCMTSIYTEMKLAFARHEKLMVEHCDLNNAKSSPSPQHTAALSNTKLVLLTDGFCGSACLDFMDTALKIPGSIHIGLPTNADTNYLDLAEAPLPSSIATLYYAMKVYRHRSRGNNVAYDPSIKFDTTSLNEKAIQQWVLNKVIDNNNPPSITPGTNQ